MSWPAAAAGRSLLLPPPHPDEEAWAPVMWRGLPRTCLVWWPGRWSMPAGLQAAVGAGLASLAAAPGVAAEAMPRGCWGGTEGCQHFTPNWT